MMKTLFLFLLFWAIASPMRAQRSPSTIADSALALIGGGAEYYPREVLSGNVSSYVITARLGSEVDYLVQLLMVRVCGFYELPESKKEPQIPGPYIPFIKMAFDEGGLVTWASLSVFGATRNIPRAQTDTAQTRSFFRFKYDGDTITAESNDGEKMPWSVVRFLKNGQLLGAKSKVESDVVFYDDFVVTGDSLKTVIEHFTQAVVYDSLYQATYLPDTPGVTLRNKYKPDAPDTHALRKRTLDETIVINRTADGYVRQFFKGEVGEDPIGIAKVNKHGMLTEATVRLYSSTLVKFAYEYDEHGNWIKCTPSFPDEKEMVNISPFLRKITYRP